MADNFNKLSGVIGSTFQLDKTKQSALAATVAGPTLINKGGDLKVGNPAGTAFAQVYAQVKTSDSDVLVTQAMLLKRFLIESSFDSSSIPVNSNSPKFLLCHTGGTGGYADGDLAYDNGVNDASPVIRLPVASGYLITIGASATTGGVIPALSATSAYIWDGAAYVQLASGNIAGMVKSIKVEFLFSSSTVNSTATIPANSTILRSSVRVTSAFDDVTSTVTVGHSSTPTLLQATTDNLLTATGNYVVENTSTGAGWGGAALAVRAVVTPGISAFGAGYVVVEYSTPET